MLRKLRLKKDNRGSAVVEAAILLPIMIMIYAGLVLLAMYLPTRALLQRATQYAATAIATQRSDTWLDCDAEGTGYEWVRNKKDLDNVYAALFHAIGSGEDGGEAEAIVSHVESAGIQNPVGELKVEYSVTNYVIYKEISITATRTIPMPVDLSFVKFPKEIPVTVTSTAVVQDGDEFVRDMDIAADVAAWLDEKYNISQAFSKVGDLCSRFKEVLGI